MSLINGDLIKIDSQSFEVVSEVLQNKLKANGGIVKTALGLEADGTIVVLQTEVGANDGVCPLDSGAKVPLANLPEFAGAVKAGFYSGSQSSNLTAGNDCVLTESYKDPDADWTFASNRLTLKADKKYILIYTSYCTFSTGSPSPATQIGPRNYTDADGDGEANILLPVASGSLVNSVGAHAVAISHNADKDVGLYIYNSNGLTNISSTLTVLEID
jgi:hypothetical protein